MLYTGKGDNGMTTVFGCDQRISKSSAVAEALGALDEINSFLGLCKVHEKAISFQLLAISFSEIIHQVQQNLFIIQAEVAGARKSTEESRVGEIEKIIDAIEKELPPIKTFLYPAGRNYRLCLTLLGRLPEERREESWKSERKENKNRQLFASYLNRLSSLLYALARLTNHKSGINEESPSYQ